jgi:hypothetical protein
MSEKRLALYEYPTSLSSPKIEPIDTTSFKRYGVTKANDFSVANGRIYSKRLKS